MAEGLCGSEHFCSRVNSDKLSSVASEVNYKVAREVGCTKGIIKKHSI